MKHIKTFRIYESTNPQTQDMQTKVKECIKDNLGIKDIAKVAISYPETLKLCLAFAVEDEITFPMIQASFEELTKEEKDIEWTCNKISDIMECVSKKCGVVVDQDTKNLLAKACKGGASLMKAGNEFFKRMSKVGGTGGIPEIRF